MAADKKSSKQAEEDEGAAPATSGDEAKKKKKKLFIMIGLGVLLVAVSIGSTILVIKLITPKKTDAETAAASAPADSADAEHSPASNASGEAEAEASPIVYLALKPNFTVNYDVNGRQRFLQAELTVMYRNEAVLKILELHMPAVRNGLVLLLSNQTFDDLQTVEGKEKVRAEALKIVQDILIKEQMAVADKADKTKKPLPNIEQILFTNFVMQ